MAWWQSRHAGEPANVLVASWEGGGGVVQAIELVALSTARDRICLRLIGTSDHVRHPGLRPAFVRGPHDTVRTWPTRRRFRRAEMRGVHHDGIMVTWSVQQLLH